MAPESVSTRRPLIYKAKFSTRNATTMRLEDLQKLLDELAIEGGSTVEEGTNLKELVDDSIDYIELAMEIQERFDIPVDVLPEYCSSTVKDLLEYAGSVTESATSVRQRLAAAKTPLFPSSPNRVVSRRTDDPIDV